MSSNRIDAYVTIALLERIRILEADHDKLVERSVGAMAIAEGDEGWEKVPLDCPMLEAVAALRRLLDNTRIDVAHRSNVSAGLQMRAEQAECRIRDLEKDVAEATARQMGLVYHVPGHVTAGAIQEARQFWSDLQSKLGRIEAAANEVLNAYMPQFSDSRMVDDCLVALAAAVSGVKTEAPKADHTAQCKICYYRSGGPLGYGLYCYMFADSPTGPCAKRRLEPIL